MRLDHLLCFSSARSIHEHAAAYVAMGLVPQSYAARWEPGLRTRFVALPPEYLELVGVEDEAAFAASDDPIKRHRSAGRPFGLGIMCADLPAARQGWQQRGFELPEIKYESPADTASGAEPLFAFMAVPPEILPGVDGFVFTSYYRPEPPSRRQVWVSPNSVFALEGLTLVDEMPAEAARKWCDFLTPGGETRTTGAGVELLLGPHRLTWLGPAECRSRYGDWRPAEGGCAAIALVELLALDLQRVSVMAAAAGRTTRRLSGGELIIEPGPYDGYRFLVRQGSLDEWVSWRNLQTGIDHAVARIDQLAERGRPGLGEYVLRDAAPGDSLAIDDLGAEVSSAASAPFDLCDEPQLPPSNGFVLVAESLNAGIIGMAEVHRDGERAPLVRSLAVSPRFVGRGIGRALLGEIERRCLADADTLLVAHADADERAARFYRLAGFGPVHSPNDAHLPPDPGITYLARKLSSRSAGVGKSPDTGRANDARARRS